MREIEQMRHVMMMALLVIFIRLFRFQKFLPYLARP
jgi:hypothetical protein